MKTLDEIRAEICDHICKYVEIFPEEHLTRMCEECVLNELEGASAGGESAENVEISTRFNQY